MENGPINAIRMQFPSDNISLESGGLYVNRCTDSACLSINLNLIKSLFYKAILSCTINAMDVCFPVCNPFFIPHGFHDITVH